jgi:hypothetical protein
VTNAAGLWEWDECLYAGAARYYPAGRMPYPASLASAIANELALDGTGRLLDVGCGPGSLTLLLAPLFGSATGIDGARWRRERRLEGTAGRGHRSRPRQLPRGHLRAVISLAEPAAGR